MAVKFDRILVAVPDRGPAIEQYQRLLGSAPWIFDNQQGEATAWWGLSNTVIELVQGTVERPCLYGIALALSEAGRHESPVHNSLDLDVRVCDGLATADFRRTHPGAQCAGLSVDHLVLRTDNAQSCIELFASTLGIRLALDRTVPEWGGRMLFFRAGKLTLEAIQSDDDTLKGNHFHGIAFQCQNIERTAEDLVERGVTLSDIREGRKPGTFVATVKSHCLGLPTLLIQPAK